MIPSSNYWMNRTHIDWEITPSLFNFPIFHFPAHSIFRGWWNTGIPEYHHPKKLKSSQKLKSGDLRFRLIKSQVRGSYAREKVNEHFSIVSGDCTLHDDSYGCFAVANASIDREIWTNKGDLARVTKYGNILMVLLGIATMNNLE